ncbi:MAG: ImmA/IrrE family metallo-endopeptidase [Trichloromonas sp.]|jgi:HTH-type transcriptional regulator/antitoxin HigA|nr:ImmA/IrrE family metallo-endopeptidase [Trichloromonas sp.]
MKPKVIKNETEYEAALERIAELMDAGPGTDEFDELELLAMLVDTYESKAHPVDLPDPIEAIRFRMDQAGLKPKDLVPLIGSASKVSEVLSGKRTLSISMMRNLHREMGIPAEVLLQDPNARLALPLEGVEWERFPLRDIFSRQWLPDFAGSLTELKERAEELLGRWAAPLGAGALEPALLRQHVRAGGNADGYALTAWKIRVSLRALEDERPAYKPGTVTPDFVRDLARLSYLDKGPLLAQEYLQKNGIHFVVEKHLPHTHLDGAAIRMPDGSPLVALTLRHDRQDNFWFTLCHELAHVALHFDGDENEAFFDDLDQPQADAIECDADRWASEALIPSEAWNAAGLCKKPTLGRVRVFAAAHRINPAIPAGRIRRETGNYQLFGKYVAQQKVKHFWGIG